MASGDSGVQSTLPLGERLTQFPQSLNSRRVQLPMSGKHARSHLTEDPAVALAWAVYNKSLFSMLVAHCCGCYRDCSFIHPATLFQLFGALPFESPLYKHR